MRGTILSISRSVGLVLIATAALAGPLTGQSRINTQLDTTLVTVGDRLTLMVSVEHANDATVSWPDSIDLSPFEVIGATAHPTQQAEDRSISAASFVLTIFELGEVEVPSFSVDVLSPDGGRETLGTDRYGVEVVSVGADESGDIREIRGPFMIPLSAITIALGLLVLILLVLALALGYRKWRASRSTEEAAVGPPPRPAHELALEALADLEASPMLAHGQFKEYHIEVSMILRRFIEARYQVMALEMTTWEIIDGLGGVRVGAEFCGDLRRLLDQCDLVKFAKVCPTDAASEQVVTRGRELVEASVLWMPEDLAAVAERVAEPVAEAVGEPEAVPEAEPEVTS